MRGVRSAAAGAASERGRALLERWPPVYLRLAQRRNPSRLLVGPGVDVVVEGFPRCGNTFLVAWFEQSNPEIRIASHLHSHAHVRAALQQGVPTVVAARDPEDAVASEIVRATAADGTTSPSRLLARYERFYRHAARWVDDLIISPFATTTASPGLVVAALRDRTGLDLRTEPASGPGAVVSAVEGYTVTAIGRVDELAVARPSAARQALAARIKEELRQQHGSRLDELRGLHDTLVSGPSAVVAVPERAHG
jgi:hypothetical protein